MCVLWRDNPCVWGHTAAVAWCTRGALGRCWRGIWDLVNGNLQLFWVRVSMKWCWALAKLLVQPLALCHLSQRMREASCVEGLKITAITPDYLLNGPGYSTMKHTLGVLYWEQRECSWALCNLQHLSYFHGGCSSRRPLQAVRCDDQDAICGCKVLAQRLGEAWLCWEEPFQLCPDITALLSLCFQSLWTGNETVRAVRASPVRWVPGLFPLFPFKPSVQPWSNHLQTWSCLLSCQYGQESLLIFFFLLKIL